MSSKSIYVSVPEVVDCDIGGDRVLLHVEQNTYFTINPTASVLWHALKDPCDLAHLVKVITEEFDVTAAECQADIVSTLDAMVSAHIVKETLETEHA